MALGRPQNRHKYKEFFQIIRDFQNKNVSLRPNYAKRCSFGKVICQYKYVIPVTENEVLEIQKQVVDVCKLVYDPEIPVNIYDLGLVYDIDVREGGHVHIKMTLTAPSCPEGDFLMEDLRMKVEGLREVSSCEVELTFEPEWNQDMMTEEAKLELGFL